jgi:hypothetical protein
MLGAASWSVLLHPEVAAWFLGLCRTDPATADGVEDAIDQLADQGPGLGRPLVDRIQGSGYHNMKELRPGSTGRSEIRMLFAFDPARRAVFVVAGDKSGAWDRWYREAIPVADERYAAHLAMMKEDDQ